MKYCSKLFNDINFEPRALAPCCQTGSNPIPLFPYEGGAIDLDAYAEHVAKTFEQIQNGGEACKNCPELREVKYIPQMSGKFSAISINMHRYFCNCKCVYCNYWKHPERGKGYNVLPGLVSLKDGGALASGAFVSWGGGEPGILLEFDEAAKWLTQIGTFQYVHTNALRYSPAIAEILSQGKGKINVSLDSGDPGTYQNVKGLNGYAQVTSNIMRYAEAGADNVELKYILFEENNNKEDIKRFIDFARSTGIKNIQFSFDFHEINSGGPSAKTLLAAAYMIVLSARNNLQLTPFFVSDAIMEKIRALVDAL